MYSCSQEQHNRCENSALCHLCDGVRLYKNSAEERQRKMQARQQKKDEERNDPFRVHKAEKKEGMAFEKDVAKAWNSAYQKPKKQTESFLQGKKHKIQKPRIMLDDPADEAEDISEPEYPEVITPAVSLSGLTKPKPVNMPVVDAKRQANSGALWYAKGDIKTEDYLMECKERGTINAKGEKTISIPREWLVKQEKEAFQENRRYWVVPFRYKNDDEIYVIKTLDQEIELYQENRRLRKKIEALTSNDKT